MVDYRVDADALTALGFSLGDVGQASPAGALAGASGCGSERVGAALDASGAAFAVGWGDAAEAVVALAVGAVEAADVYRATDVAVTRGAEAAS